jgi:hypothetical protein
MAESRFNELRCTALVACVELDEDPATFAIRADRPYDVIARPTPARFDKINVLVCVDGCYEATTFHLWLASHQHKAVIGRAMLESTGQPTGFIQHAVALPEVVFPATGDYWLTLFGPDKKILFEKRILVASSIGK